MTRLRGFILRKLAFLLIIGAGVVFVAPAVGTGGEIWQYNGTSWSAMTSPTTEDLADIHVLSSTTAYAVGRDTDGSVGVGIKEGNVLKFDGTSWTSILITDLDERLNGVWAGSASEVYAVGRGGALQVYDGTSWTDLSTVAGATADRLNDAWGDANFFYALAQNGTIYKRDRALPATASAWAPDSSMNPAGVKW